MEKKIVRGVEKDQSLFRLLDANLNRCREGFRVLEDTARFVWKKEKLFQLFRSLRHRVDLETRAFYPQLVAHRDSHSDAGRKMKEGGRENISSVVYANFRRCEESLRVLEEYGKVFSGQAGGAFKKIRFKVYSLEKEVLQFLKYEG